MTPELARSYAHCRKVARARARNFYYAFAILPPAKRDAMCAVYAFMRHSDDVSDEPGLAPDRQAAMCAWRAALDDALRGEYGDDPVLPALHDTVRTCAIPPKLLHELIDGVEMDLTKTRYATFDELYGYCYRVASVVGLVCLYVWGFAGGEEALQRAEACGIAFQLTNILRDLKEDIERDRVYLPQEDLARFGYTETDLARGVMDDPFRALMRFEAERARAYYATAEPLAAMISPVSRPAFGVMYRIYRGLLERIEACDYDVFSRRVSVPKATKARLMAGAWLSRMAQHEECV